MCSSECRWSLNCEPEQRFLFGWGKETHILLKTDFCVMNKVVLSGI